MIKRRVSIVGLGYVGLPLAVAFSKKTPSKLVAFDIKNERIEELKQGYDKTREVSSHELKTKMLLFTNDPEKLKQADFHVVTVPTPVDSSKRPDLRPLISASKTVGSALKTGDIVVFESTVYPGTTEEVCLPILEKISGLQAGRDFFIGYSPERINPGDKVHSLTSIVKVVSGQTPRTLKIIAETYAQIIKAGIHKASSIRVAEAAKVIENAQRDINIAFVNELKIIFDKMHIDTHEVLEAAKTKWNFLDFTPGLVGGHCIGVDPYYLTYKAQQVGYHPRVILSGRQINDGMGKYFAEQAIKKMIEKNIHVHGAKVGVLGITFKENCPDIRNSKVIDIVTELQHYHVTPVVVDPIANKQDVLNTYGIELSELTALKGLKVLIIAVSHKEFASEKYMSTIAGAEMRIDIKKICGDKPFKTRENKKEELELLV